MSLYSAVSDISSNGRDVSVDFPQQSNWIGIVAEMEVVPCCHQGVSCDGCLMYPITGPRFKCKACDDFNYCENCFYTKKIHRHSFNRVVEPGKHIMLRCARARLTAFLICYGSFNKNKLFLFQVLSISRFAFFIIIP